MRILVTGSRTWTDVDAFTDAIDYVIGQGGANEITIVHGACPRGADQMAVEYVDSMASWYEKAGKRLAEERHPANWDSCEPDCTGASHRVVKKPGDVDHPGHLPDYCPDAGPRRNAAMVCLGADICLAFICNGSLGASATADLAKKAGIATKRWTA